MDNAAACCAISVCCSPMAMVALRRTGSAFAFTLYVMVPSPWPDCPDTSSTHEADALADQLHSRATETLTEPAPPVELKLGAELVMVAWQRAAVGPVTLVTALLPHADSHAAHPAYTRARRRMVTDKANSRPAPSAVGA